MTFGYTETPMAELDPDVLIDSFAELPAAQQVWWALVIERMDDKTARAGYG